MKDDEFLLDKIQYEETYELELTSDDQKSLETLMEKEKVYCYSQKNVQYFQYVSSPLRAFSICWPYVTFSGLLNYIIIVNAFDGKNLRRIQVAENDAKITIC